MVIHAFQSLSQEKILCQPTLQQFLSEPTPEGVNVTELEQILLNGNNICLVCRNLILIASYDSSVLTASVIVASTQLVPGGSPEDSLAAADEKSTADGADDGAFDEASGVHVPPPPPERT